MEISKGKGQDVVKRVLPLSTGSSSMPADCRERGPFDLKTEEKEKQKFLQSALVPEIEIKSK